MADRYQNRPFPAPDYDRGDDPHAAGRAESDPLAELARLIGQTDPFAAAAKPPPHPLQSRANPRPQAYDPPEEEEDVAPMPPPWMQRARQEAAPPQQDYTSQDYVDEEQDYAPAPVHPLHRYAAQSQAPAQHYQQDYQEEPQYAEEQYADEPQQTDPSRYDDALYGQIDSGQQQYQRDPAYPDDPYAYQNDYEDEPEPKRRSSGLMTVAAVLALAVVGTGAAFAYRTYVGSPRTGEPPIIRADNSPTKIVPAPADGSTTTTTKTPDRMLPGDGGEKLVSREETPVDVNSRSGAPRVVFPPLNQNGSPPPISSVSPNVPPPAAAANGTMPNNEPRKIKTLAVKGDAAENGGAPAGVAPPATPAKPARAVPSAPAAHNPSSANASANAPLSLAPQAGAPADPAPAPAARIAATNPVQAAPAAGGGFVVQVSSQKSEADAQASFRALQGKYPNVLGSQSVLVKRVDLGEKGIYYRAFAGPFSSSDQATQVCNSLKAAGGPQCLIQRN
jgi:SPOR domain